MKYIVQNSYKFSVKRECPGIYRDSAEIVICTAACCACNEFESSTANWSWLESIMRHSSKAMPPPGKMPIQQQRG